MTDEQKDLLATRLKSASAMQPELLTLRNLLLQFGGTELVAPPDFDPDLEGLLQPGVWTKQSSSYQQFAQQVHIF